MLSFRLLLDSDDGLLAGLNLYSAQPDAFDDTAAALGTLIGTHGGLAVAAAAARDRADDLAVALVTGREIGTAIGVLMATHKVTRQQAFDLLRIASQRANRKLRDVADTGSLPLPAPSRRHPDAPAGRPPTGSSRPDGR